MMLRHRLLGVVAAFLLLPLSLIGCGGGGSDTPKFAQPSGTKLTELFAYNGSVSWEDVQKMHAGDIVYALVNDSGTDVYKRPMSLQAAYAEGGDWKIVLQPADGDKYGPGDSGTPIVTADGKLIGAIYSGYDSGSIYARSVEQMLKYSYRGRAQGQVRASGVPSKLYLSTSSVAAQNLVSRYGGRLPVTFVKSSTASGRAALLPTEFAPGRKFTFIAGTGPEVAIYGAATLTDYDPVGVGWVATGHTIDGLGDRQLPVAIASADFRLGDGSVVSRPMTEATHTMTYDGDFASLIQSGAPAMTDLVVKVTMPDGKVQTITQRVCRDSNQGAQQVGTYYGLMVPVANRMGASLPDSWDVKAVLTFQFEGNEGKVETLEFEKAEDMHMPAVDRISDLLFSKLIFTDKYPNRDLMSATLEVTMVPRDPKATPAPTPTPMPEPIPAP